MGRHINRLSARTITSTNLPGLYADGGGLYLQVTKSGSKTWIFRYRSPTTSKTRDMGLGPIHTIGLSDAREKAATHRKTIENGMDPISVRAEEERQRAAEAAKAITFAQCADSYIQSHRPGWRNAKHGDQWENTIKTYANPVIGSLSVQDVETSLVLKILEPIWTRKPETASRLRGRIENILDWATARGYRMGENPARWRGHLKQILPDIAKKDRVQHHKAMQFGEVAAFIAKLRTISTVTARCLELTILTAARTNESVQARPEEFDLDNAVWTIPASRMKTKKEHRIPLSPRAVDIIRELMAIKHAYVFPGTRLGRPISSMAMLQLLDRMQVKVTVHGFRSTFRDWAAECTGFTHEVCEMALAHTITNSAEAAYRRGDLFAKRRKLMEAWGTFAACPIRNDAVVELKHAA